MRAFNCKKDYNLLIIGISEKQEKAPSVPFVE